MTVTECAPAATHAMGEPAASALSATLKALADPLRLRMLSAIAADSRGESCVCDLAELADVSQPTVSHHLRVLKDVGVLASERRGTWVWYRITPELRPAVTTLLDSFAPAAVHPERRGYAGLDDVDEALTHLAAMLQARFASLSVELVTAVVRESYASLARSARISTHLVSLTKRFATQRLMDITRDRDNGVPQVLFVCVANAGRSQLAAALVNQLSGGRVIARSAGSAPAAEIHPNVEPLLAEIGDNDLHFPKPITDDAVRAADVVVTMGCGDVCPIIPGVRYEDWAVGDPALASPEGVAAIRDDIAERVNDLLTTLLTDTGASE
ncbi:metalloregulator ArsR/SmtB family transcription factor [Salinibacterium sp. SYSU T00001]|uniref:metalloregulator ArsR/SmtB family transcription factor n=1 Tax=Homoserinimonas sedimenticola TaxID=2986805 RepID=UPI002235FE6C|nr:metalloregulator ArsR/SmtB family transcription factor [Salinibacterium sedimenticola]MCW4385653.1 metalloregulator ArsR/SmtB family transcription factor [Salinibacterium sedimenticola]